MAEKLGKINDVIVPIEVVLGNARLALADFSQLGEGTILELDRACGEPALVKAGDKIIAQGEVMAIGENFGLRITKLFDERS